MFNSAADVQTIVDPKGAAKSAGLRYASAAIENVAVRLGNNSICRKCYVHPEVLTSYLDGHLVLEIKSAVDHEALDGLKPEEAAVLAMLRGRELSSDVGRVDVNKRLIAKTA